MRRAPLHRAPVGHPGDLGITRRGPLVTASRSPRTPTTLLPVGTGTARCSERHASPTPSTGPRIRDGAASPQPQVARGRHRARRRQHRRIAPSGVYGWRPGPHGAATGAHRIPDYVWISRCQEISVATACSQPLRRRLPKRLMAGLGKVSSGPLADEGRSSRRLDRSGPGASIGPAAARPRSRWTARPSPAHQVIDVLVDSTACAARLDASQEAVRTAGAPPIRSP